MSRDTDKGRARDAKASVQDAIGKLTGDTDAAREVADEVDGVEAKATRSRTKPSSTSSAKPDRVSRSDAKHSGQTTGKT